MSLINKVTKDANDRGNSKQIPGLQKTSLGVRLKRASFFRAISHLTLTSQISLGASLLFGATVFIILIQTPTSHVTTTTNIANPLNNTPTRPKQHTLDLSSFNSLKNALISTEAPNLTKLKLEFSKLPYYWLQEMLDPHKLKITFPNTKMDKPLPANLLRDSTAIAEIETLQQKDNLNFNLTLKSETALKELTPEDNSLKILLERNAQIVEQEQLPPSIHIQKLKRNSHVASHPEFTFEDAINQEDKIVEKDILADEARDSIRETSSTRDGALSIHKIRHKPSPKERADHYYRNAVQDVANNRNFQAILSLKEGLRFKPDHTPSLQLMATIYLNKNQPEKALHFIYKGIEVAEDPVPFIKLEAHSLIQQNNPRGALKVLSSAPPLSIADHLDFYSLLASLYLRVKEYPDAAQLYEQMLQFNSGNGKWWAGLAMAQENLGFRNNAIKSYKKSLLDQQLPPGIRAYASGQLGKSE